MAEMKRGANVSLTREIPNLRGLVLGAMWNAGAERLLGWSAEEILGRPADIFFTREGREAGAPAHETAGALATAGPRTSGGIRGTTARASWAAGW